MRPGSFRRWLAHLLVRAILVGHSGLVWVAGRLVPRQPPGAGGRRILLTGTFESHNWARAHLLPLARSPWCERIEVVATTPVPPIEKVVAVAPPRWLVRVAGSGTSRLVTLGWRAFVTRPHVVGGFHLLLNGLAALAAARLCGARALYFCVGGPNEVLEGGIRAENRLFEKMETRDFVVERQLLRVVSGFDFIVTMGTRARAFFGDRGIGVPCHVIAGGFEAERFAPSSEAPTTDIITVCRLSHIKRIDVLLRAVKLILDRRPGTTATIVGDGEERPALEALASVLGLEEAVSFVGRRTDVAGWLRKARIFMLTSDSEGLPLAMVEAMMCGLPVVASEVGDIPDVIQPGVCGELAPPNRPDIFAERALALLGDEETRVRYGQAAVAAAGRYRVERTAELWCPILADPSAPLLQ